MPYFNEELEFETGLNPLRNRLKWLMILRVILISLLLGSISIIQIRLGYSKLASFFLLVILTYVLTILYSVLFRYMSELRVLSYIQIVGDILIEVALIYLTGGIESPFSFTIIITILTASIMLSRRGTLIIASVGSILYGLLIDLQFFGTLPFPHSYIPMAEILSSEYVFHTIFVNISAFFMIALLSAYLAESRKRANLALVAKEEDLRELRAFNEDVLRNMHSGLIVTNLEGKVTFFNRTAKDLFDIKTKNNHKNYYWKDFFGIIDYNNVIESLMEEPENILSFNDFFNCEKTKGCFLGLRISLLKDSKNKAKGTITCFQNLTEFKKMEEKVRETELLASIGGMATGIAHELRNPLGSIKGLIQLLSEEIKLGPEHENLVDIILKESNHLNNIINDFLLYAKPKPPALERCNINNLIQDTITMLKNSENFNKNIIINLGFEDQYNDLMIDLNQIKQVIWNMAINACQAMPEGGILIVKTSLMNKKKKSFKIIEFKDTGRGIDHENLPKIFLPFFTTKDRGMGLGLSIAYRIIEAHNGTIEAESIPNKGSTFRIYLPVDTKGA